MEVAKVDVLPMCESTNHKRGKFFNFKFIFQYINYKVYTMFTILESFWLVESNHFLKITLLYTIYYIVYACL